METYESVRLHCERRTLALSPLWCAQRGEWLVADEAQRLYEATFGPLKEGEQLQLWLDGRDVTHTRFQELTALQSASGRFTAKKVGPSHALDLVALVQHSRVVGRKELMRTETAQFVLQRVPLGGAVGERNNTLPERHPGITQFILVLQGVADVTLSSDAEGLQVLERHQLTPQQCVVVPPNTYHYVRQMGSVELVFFSVYSPPEEEAK